MAAGRPVVCLALGGPGFQVTAETGVKIQANFPEQVSHDLAKAFLRLASDPALRLQLGLCGKKRVEKHFNWDRKGEFMTKVYESLVMVEGKKRTVDDDASRKDASAIVFHWTMH